MSSLVFLIEQTAIGWYILIGVGVFVYWRRWVLARSSRRATHFELERDLARYQTGSAFTAMILLIEAGLVVVGVQQVVAPTIREARAEEGIVIDIEIEDGDFATPTPPVIVEGVVIGEEEIPDLGPQDDAVIFATPTLTPTPVGTILPNMPAPVGCTTPNAFLQIPANGMVVHQPIEVRGSAFIEDFAKWRLEIFAADSDAIYLFDESLEPMPDIGNLSQFDPAWWEPGMYRMRLMVFDTTDMLQASCEVTIEIREPIPTPTPLGE